MLETRRIGALAFVLGFSYLFDSGLSNRQKEHFVKVLSHSNPVSLFAFWDQVTTSLPTQVLNLIGEAMYSLLKTPEEFKGSE